MCHISQPQLLQLAHETQYRAAEMALARLSAVSDLVPVIEWLLYSTMRKEALLTSQIEGAQATLTDLCTRMRELRLTIAMMTRRSPNISSGSPPIVAAYFRSSQVVPINV